MDLEKDIFEGLNTENPYPGLKPFREEDRDFFFGRSREVKDLFRLVRRSVLTVCFGKSGLGKTSLLNAGLFPQLRKDRYLPISVRLNFAPDAEDLVLQVKRRIKRELDLWKVDAPEPEEAETLWEYFHRSTWWDSGNHLIVPVLIFDQFEECFTLGRNNTADGRFFRALANLIENQVPVGVRKRLSSQEEALPFSYERQRFRVVLSLREDFLAHLEDLRSLMPSLGYNRFRLSELTGSQALEAVMRPGGQMVTEGTAAAIIRFAAGQDWKGDEPSSDDFNAISIEPALLALVCRRLNDKRIEQNKSAITQDLLSGESGRIYADFYRENLTAVSSTMRFFVEEKLITASGFRTAEPMEEALRGGITEEEIRVLVDRRVLRLETRLGIPHVELIHDVLTKIVLDSREARRETERKAKARRRALYVGGGVMAVVVLLVFWAVHESKLRLRAVEMQQRAVEQRQRAEEQRQRAEDAKVKANQTISFVFDLSEKLRGLGRPDLFRDISIYLGEYKDSLEEYREDDFAILTVEKQLYFDGLNFLERKDTANAHERFQKYLKIVQGILSERTSDLWRLEVAKTYEIIGDVYEIMGETEQSLRHYELARDALGHFDNPDKSPEQTLLLVSVPLKISDNLEKQQDYKQAIRVLDKALQNLTQQRPLSKKRGTPPPAIAAKPTQQVISDINSRISKLSSKTGRSITDRERANAFVNDYIKLIEGPADRIDDLLQFYGERVDYYRISNASHDDIRRDKVRYFKRFPNLVYKLLSGVEVSKEDELKVLKFTYAFDAFNPEKGRYRFGKARNILKVRESRDGWKIISEKQKVLEVKEK